jgi:hypothetical protein
MSRVLNVNEPHKVRNDRVIAILTNYDSIDIQAKYVDSEVWVSVAVGLIEGVHVLHAFDGDFRMSVARGTGEARFSETLRRN